MLLKRIHKKIIKGIPLSGQTIATDFKITNKEIKHLFNTYVFDIVCFKNACDCCFGGINYWVLGFEFKNKKYWTLLSPRMTEQQVLEYTKPFLDKVKSRMN
jgi:hypothetical protein